MEVRSGEESVSLAGEIVNSETITSAQLLGSGYKPQETADLYERILLKIGNREFGGGDFVWVVRDSITRQTDAGRTHRHRTQGIR